MEVGEVYENTINKSTAEVIQIKNGIVTFHCCEKTSGFLHVVTEPVFESAVRSQDINYINKKYIKTGILKKI